MGGHQGAITVETPFGPVSVAAKVAQAWHVHGLPSDDVLRRMVAQQAAHRLRREGNADDGR